MAYQDYRDVVQAIEKEDISHKFISTILRVLGNATFLTSSIDPTCRTSDCADVWVAIEKCWLTAAHGLQ